MAQFTFFDEFKNYLGQGVIDLDGHTFKAMLTNVAPVADTDDTASDITEISAGNGYVAGGMTLTSVTWVETGPGSGVWRFNCNDFTWNASGGNFPEFRYVVFYDDTPTSPADPLIGFVDYGTGIVLTNGNGFTVDIGAEGVFELSEAA